MFDIEYQEEGREMRALLASNLRRLRIARGLSLSVLARMTAMSKATLSGIERSSANPTIDTLASIAGALRIPMTELLEAPAIGDVRIVRAELPGAAPSAGAALRTLERAPLDGELELSQLSIAAGHAHELPAAAHGSRSALLVLEGTLIAGPVERVSELACGDYISFPADVPHLYEAVRGAARALLLAQTHS